MLFPIATYLWNMSSDGFGIPRTSASWLQLTAPPTSASAADARTKDLIIDIG
jgi:hypothetical protein